MVIFLMLNMARVKIILLHIVVHAVMYMVLNAAHAILLHALSVLMDITWILMVIVQNLTVKMGMRWITLAAH